MAKQAKMKKGSIGKKALAAILAASMVLSSSAFSVLAAPVSDPDVMPIVLPSDDEDVDAYRLQLSGAKTKVYDGTNLTVNSLTYNLVKKEGEGTQSSGDLEGKVELKAQKDGAGDELDSIKDVGSYSIYAKGVTHTNQKSDADTYTITKNQATLAIGLTTANESKTFKVGDTLNTTDFEIKVSGEKNGMADSNIRSEFTIKMTQNGENFSGGTITKADPIVVTATPNTQNFANEVKSYTLTPSLQSATINVLLEDPANPSGAGVSTSDYKVSYNGSATDAKVKSITVNGQTLTSPADYEARCYNNTGVGKACGGEDPTDNNYSKGPYLVITFKGEWGKLPTKYIPYTIEGAAWPTAAEDKQPIWHIVEGYTYNGQKQHPTLTSLRIKKDNSWTTLTEGNGYKLDETTVGSNDLINAGTNKKVRYIGDGNYENTANAVELTYHIDQKTLAQGDVRIKSKPVVYTVGSASISESALGIQVYDALKSSEDTADNLVASSTYTVEYKQKDGSWKANAPVASIGENELRIVITNGATGNFKEDENAYATGTYQVVSSQTLAMKIAEGFKIGEFTSANNGKITYDGKDHFPSDVTSAAQIEIGTGSDKLELGKDYRVVTEKTEWKNAAEYEFVVEGLEVLAGQRETIKVTIEPKKMTTDKTHTVSGITVTVQQGKHTNGTMSTIVTTVKDTIDGKEVVLEEGKDYTVDTTSKTNYAIISGINNYTTVIPAPSTDTTYEQAVTQLTTLPLNDPSIEGNVNGAYALEIKGQTITVDPANIVLTENISPTPYSLSKDTDFYIAGYRDPDGTRQSAATGVTKAGTAHVIVGVKEGSDKFTAGTEYEIEFTVDGIIFADTVSIDAIPEQKLGADGKLDLVAAVGNKITVRYNEATKGTLKKDEYDIRILDADGNELSKGTYSGSSYSWSPARREIESSGTYKVEIIPRDGRFVGTAEASFTVTGIDVSKNVNVKFANATYTGEAIEPEMTVVYSTDDTRTTDDVTLTKGTDYTVEYDNNVNAGTGYAIITFTGKYSGKTIAPFTIAKADATVDLDATQKSDLASGVAVNSTMTLKLTASMKDETLSYQAESNDTSIVDVDGTALKFVKVGDANVTITPTSKNLNLTPVSITVPVKVSATAASGIKTPTFTPSNKISKKAKTFTVTTSTIKGATKWQIRYSLKDLTKTTKGSKYVTVKNTTKVVRKVINCNKSKKKYYIRVRAYVNGKWSSWSPQKSIKSR